MKAQDWVEKMQKAFHPIFGARFKPEKLDGFSDQPSKYGIRYNATSPDESFTIKKRGLDKKLFEVKAEIEAFQTFNVSDFSEISDLDKRIISCSDTYGRVIFREETLIPTCDSPGRSVLILGGNLKSRELIWRLASGSFAKRDRKISDLGESFQYIQELVAQYHPRVES